MGKTNKNLSLKASNDRKRSPLVASTEGARRATGVEATNGDRSGNKNDIYPDPEVTEIKPRRKFTAKYKLHILAEADACTVSGELGHLLRREGLYSSNLTTWRRQKEQGILNAMKPKKRGRKTKKVNPLASKVARLEKEKRQLEDKLKKAGIIIEAQKKISELMELTKNIDES